MVLWKKLFNVILTGAGNKLQSGSTLTADTGSTVTLNGTNTFGTSTISTVKTTAVQIGAAGSEANLSVPVPVLYTSVTPTEGAFFVNRAYYVDNIYARAQTQASTAANMIFYKIPSTVSGVASGSQISTGSLDLLATTANIVKTIGLTSTAAVLTLATGDGIGYVVSGTPTSARGSITFNMRPI